MIRRGVGALLVLSLTIACVAPAQAQPAAPSPVVRRHSPTFWALIGAAAGAVVGGVTASVSYDWGPGVYPEDWTRTRTAVTGAMVGAAVGAGLGLIFGRNKAREAGVPGGPYFVVLAEGLTSATITEGIRVAPRQFTASQLVEACKDPRVVERLDVAPNPLEMRADGRYALNSLSVVAINAADVAMEGLPIVLEAEEANPPIIALRSDDPDLSVGRLHALRAGTFQMRIRTMCGTPHAERVILGLVSP
jgi:hypothetical protein